MFKGDSAKFPFGIKEDAKKLGDKFTNVNNISYFGGKATKYPDGTAITITDGMNTDFEPIFPDGSTMDIDQRTYFMIGGYYIFKLFGRDNPFYVKMMDVFLNKDVSQADIDTLIKDATVENRNKIILYSAFILLSIGSRINLIIDACKSGKSDTSSFNVDTDCSGYKAYCYILANTLNMDLLNNKPSIGNGWSDYTFDNAKVSSTGVTSDAITISPEMTFDSRKIKAIALQYRGSEVGYTAAGYSTVDVTATSDKTPAGAVYKSNTSFLDNPVSPNYNVTVLNMDYPVVLTNLKIRLSTNKSTSATVSDGKLLVVYE